jgi:Aldo/keto reductase family
VRPEGWSGIAGVAVDRGEDLFQDEIVADFVRVLCGDQERPAGKIRSFGASKVPASQIVEAQWTAERRGHGRFRTEQPPCSLLTRAIEYDLLPACLRHGMGVMAYSPLAGGWLSGKYRKGLRPAARAPPLVPGAPRPTTPVARLHAEDGGWSRVSCRHSPGTRRGNYERR